MEKLNGQSLHIVHNDYLESLNNYLVTEKKKLLLAHYGEFNQDLLSVLIEQSKKVMVEKFDKKGTIKRVFSVLIEGLQNIRLHGEKDEDDFQPSFVILARNDKEYAISFGNLINDGDAKFLSSFIDLINKNLESKQLKTLYIDVLNNGLISNKGGAGLGFITMAMKSKNELGCHLSDVEDGKRSFLIHLTITRA